MIKDLNQSPSGTVFKTDVCIIGAGPAGLSLANEFIGTSLDVTIVESGGIRVEPAAQVLNHSESVGLRHCEHQQGRTRAFGGTAKSWAGQCLRLDPIDFERRAWIPYSGWPIDYAALTPYYERAESFFNVHGEVYDDRNYERLGVTRPAWSPDSIESRFTVYTPKLDTGKCHESHLRKARNINTLLHANAVDVQKNGECLPFKVAVKTIDGRASQIDSRVVILAAGAFENARLLLVSNKQCPQGLGNDRDLVGRFLQDHPNGFTAKSRSGKTKDLSSLFRLFYKGGLRYFPKFCLTPALQRRSKLLNGIAHLTFEYPEGSAVHAMRELYLALRKGRRPAGFMAHVANIGKDLGQVNHVFINRLRGKSAEIEPANIRLQCHLEQVPDPSSRVRLSDKKDVLGMPGLLVNWQKSELELETLKALTQATASEFRRQGLAELQTEDWLNTGADWRHHLYDCAHHIGTTRMAATAECGVVDSNCQVFGIEGLYVAGSSAFPTSGYANPTLTIVALSIRLADKLKTVLKSGGVR